MKAFEKGGYGVRLAATQADIKAAQALRHRAFFGVDGYDCDDFDTLCDHVLIEDMRGQLLGCFRMLAFRDGRTISESYAAQFYGLDRLSGFSSKMLEVGRFCLEPEMADSDVLRVAWAALTRYVDETNVKMLFGCASFAGVSAAPYLDSFAVLQARHLAPECWRPRPRADEIFEFTKKIKAGADLKRGMAQMPPLLRSYLTMGGWVSDHAVVDSDMGTLHVFTGLEVEAIPEARKRLLRATAA